ncbi:MAG: YdiU family protein [Sphingomonadales bacterium]|nr:YdiU family protein [Sphingomonadales bacterium]
MADDIQDKSWQGESAILSIADFIADPVAAADFPEAILRWRNDRAARDIGLAGLDDAQWIAHFGRFQPLPDSLATPLALRYHGHQFRVYNPDIGDGRGFLFAQCRDDAGRLLDLGTKGSGTTPYSRSGDGRLTLKGAVRELLATEMLAALGVATSRTFSIVETGEQLWRGDEPSPTRSAVLVRLSHGHIRIGSFQRLAAIDDGASLIRLARYSLVELLGHDRATIDAMPPQALAETLLAAMVPRAADLAASYMVAGFVHGVLNSDNIAITGESFDYGPWRFAPTWAPAFTAAYFDHGGLYSFGRQPETLHWNCAQLAIALRTIADAQPLIAILEGFADAYRDAFVKRFLWRLGVAARDPASDLALVEAAERMMVATSLPIDRFFFAYAAGRGASGDEPGRAFEELLARHRPARALDDRYWSGDAPQAMLIDEVEAIWAAIAERDDWTPLTDKIAAVRAFGAVMSA